MLYFIAESDYDYIYDPDHKKHPGGGYRKTQNGWAKGAPKVKEKQLQRTIDTTKSEGGDTFSIHESQISDEDKIIVTDANGKTKEKRYGDMSADEKNNVKKQLKLIGSFSHKGFSDYSEVSLDKFKSNMDKNLKFIENSRILLGENTSTKLIKKENYKDFQGKMRENFARVKDRYSVAVKSKAAMKALDKYENVMMNVIKKAVNDGSLGDITEKDMDAFLQEDMKRLIYQELETRRRSMGDHGIRHVVGNAVNTAVILSKLNKGGVKNGTTGKDMLTGMICQVNHDLGYTVGSVAVSGKDGTFHKTHSGTLATEERDRYEKLLGKEYADKLVGEYEVYPEDGKTPMRFDSKKNLIPYEEAKNLKPSDEKFMRSKTKHQKDKKGMIQFHDDTDYDWKNNALHSAVALADCTALFGKDKVQEFFLEDADAMEDATCMQMILTSKDFDYEYKEKAFAGFKKKMKSHIEKMKILSLDKQKLEEQVNEMTIKDADGNGFDTINDILTRSSGVLDGFEYDSENGVMVVNTSYSQDGKILEDLFGDEYARQQWDKMSKNDLGLSEIDIDKDGHQKAVYADKEHPENSKIIVNIKDMGNAPILNKGVQRAYNNLTPRLAVQQLARLGQATGENGKATLQEKIKDYDTIVEEKSKGELLFGATNWKKIKELLTDGKYNELNDLSLGNAELEYLFKRFTKYASIMIPRIASRIAKNIFKMGTIAMKIARNDLIRHFSYDNADITIDYSTDGTLILRYNNKAFYTQISEDKKGIKEFENLVEKYEPYLNNEDYKGFMKVTKLKWKKRY